MDNIISLRKKAAAEGKSLLTIYCDRTHPDAVFLMAEEIVTPNTIIALINPDKLDQLSSEMIQSLVEVMPKTNNCYRIVTQ